MQIEQLQSEIETLPKDQYALLRQWFAEKDWQQGDEQIESDSAAGKLDFLIDEANQARREATLRDL